MVGGGLGEDEENGEMRDAAVSTDSFLQLRIPGVVLPPSGHTRNGTSCQSPSPCLSQTNSIRTNQTGTRRIKSSRATLI